MMLETEKTQPNNALLNNKQTLRFAPFKQTRRDNILDVKNLCSRKLLELLSAHSDAPLTTQQQNSVQQELLNRRHYLQELEKILLSKHFPVADSGTH